MLEDLERLAKQNDANLPDVVRSPGIVNESSLLAMPPIEYLLLKGTGTRLADSRGLSSP